MIKYKYVKDKEGYAVKLPLEKITDEYTVISKSEYDKIVGTEDELILSGRGGARKGAGRKKLYVEKVKETYELEKNDVLSLKEYAKKHKISKNKALHEAIQYLTKNEA